MAPAPVVIVAIPLVDGSFFNVTDHLIAEFAAAYPAVDVTQQMVGMRVWSITNPKLRKTKNGILRFINGWLSKEQDRGGRGGGAVGALAAPKPVRPNGGSLFETGKIVKLFPEGEQSQ